MALNFPGETKAVDIGLGKMPHDHLHPHIAIAPRHSSHLKIPLTLASTDSVSAIIPQVTPTDLTIKDEAFVL